MRYRYAYDVVQIPLANGVSEALTDIFDDDKVEPAANDHRIVGVTVRKCAEYPYQQLVVVRERTEAVRDRETQEWLDKVDDLGPDPEEPNPDWIF